MSLLLPMQHIHILAHQHHIHSTTLRRPHSYIFILHVHKTSIARSTHHHVQLTEVPVVLSVFPRSHHCLFLFTCVLVWVESRRVRRFIPERASMSAMSLPATGLHVKKKCAAFLLPLSVVPTGFRHFKQEETAHVFTSCVTVCYLLFNIYDRLKKIVPATFFDW